MALRNIRQLGDDILKICWILCTMGTAWALLRPRWES